MTSFRGWEKVVSTRCREVASATMAAGIAACGFGARLVWTANPTETRAAPTIVCANRLMRTSIWGTTGSPDRT